MTIIVALVVVVVAFFCCVMSLLDSVSKAERLIKHQRDLYAKGYRPEDIECSVAELRKIFKSTHWWSA